MAGGCLQNLSVPHAAFVGKLSYPFLPMHKSDLFYIYIYINTTHSGEGLGDPACVPWVSSARDVQPGDAVGVGGCAGSIRAPPGLSFTFWVGFGLGPVLLALGLTHGRVCALVENL